MVYGSCARLCMTAYSTALYNFSLQLVNEFIRNFLLAHFRRRGQCCIYSITSFKFTTKQVQLPLYLHISCHPIFFSEKVFPYSGCILYIIAFTKRHNPEDGEVCITSRYFLVFMYSHFSNTNDDVKNSLTIDIIMSVSFKEKCWKSWFKPATIVIVSL
jgi:hypothetical protein